MITRSLQCHPATPPSTVQAVRVQVQPQPCGELALVFDIVANADSVILPCIGGETSTEQMPAKTMPAEKMRADDLWRHSCFELFAAGAGSAYRELNFAPSGQWAAYDFVDYRSGMTEAVVSRAPLIVRRQGTMTFEITLDAALLNPLRCEPRALALCAVIEERGARFSYWSLHHAVGKPDFHHRESFALGWPMVAATDAAAKSAVPATRQHSIPS